MVLESLTSPQSAEKKPWDLFFIGLMYAAIAVFLAIWVFKEEASLVMVLLTVIACVPLIYNTLRFEEERDIVPSEKKFRFMHHSRALSFLTFLFLGFVLAFSLAYIFLPPELAETTFNTQITTIKDINQQVATGSFGFDLARGVPLFVQIFSNNIKVMLFCVFFSFFYGAGAIFILTWNASVISAAIGTFARTKLSTLAAGAGLPSIAAHFQSISLGLLRYLLHGIPEIIGYFIGGLAGGIISVAVIKHDFGTTEFKNVLKDSIHLIIFGLIVLAVAGFIEVYITPLFF